MIWASAWPWFVRACKAGMDLRSVRLGMLRVCTCDLREKPGWWSVTLPPFGTTPLSPCAVRLTGCRNFGGTDRLIACWWCRGGWTYGFWGRPDTLSELPGVVRCRAPVFAV